MSSGLSRGKIAAGATAAAVAIATPLVIYFEGSVDRGYLDPVHIVTACVGSTHDTDGTRLTTEDIGKRYTPLECETMLQRDLAEHSAVLACITRPVSNNVKGATLSFAFNVGVTAACNSRYIYKLNTGDPTACAELSRWTISKGREFPGLVKRRAAERALCERPDPTPPLKMEEKVR